MGARVTLGRDGDVAVLDLTPDREHRRRALVHAGGHAVSHVGPLPPRLRAEVLALARGLVELPAGSTAALIATITRSAAAAGLGFALQPRVAPVVWPSWLRSGRPGLRDPLDLWPVDAELAALALGRRRVLKRECFTDADEARDRAWLASHDLATARVGPVEPDGRRTILAAADAATLTACAPLERAAAGHDHGAIAALGEALGYPPCCVATWQARASHDDASVWADAGADPMPRDPLALWLTQPLALFSHVPCAPGCAPTRALAGDVLAWLDGDRPGFAAAWRALAARLHVVDGDGVAWAISGVGTVATGVIVDDAVGFPRPDGAGPVARAAPTRRGALVTAADVVAAADHRAST